MIWSLLYDALSAHYSACERDGELNDDELADKLSGLQKMDLGELATEFREVLHMEPPDLENL